MSRRHLGSGAARTLIIIGTILLTWAALLIGRVTQRLDLEVGDRAPQTFYAPGPITVVDEAETEARRQQARLNQETVYRIDPEKTAAVTTDIERFFLTARQLAQPVEPEASDTPPTTEAPAEGEEEQAPTTTAPPPAEPLPMDEQVARLSEQYQNLDAETIGLVVEVANHEANGAPHPLERVLAEAVSLAQRLLGDGIKSTELTQERNELLSNPPFVFVPLDLPVDPVVTRQAVAAVVAEFLQANEVPDEAGTAAARLEAEAAVSDVEVTFPPTGEIVRQGDRITEVQLKALDEAGHLRTPDSIGISALLAVVAVLVSVLAFYLARFRPDFWARPRRVMLFGSLIVLAAFASRSLAVLLLPDMPAAGYLIPAALFGFLVAVLFEPRMAVLIAVAVGALAGLATHDPEAVNGALGYTIFAMLATLAPVPFVSAISSRGDFRRAVALNILVLAPMAGTLGWLFHDGQVAVWAAGIGAFNGLMSGALAMGVLPFLENIFDVTTTLTLLDLTDRNHPALQELEEKALGTFNHSLMVGTLADAGARAIGANRLLARAAAYYHDLGKTENPWFFIENQFGGINPHDSMPPEESADIIRQHVIDGGRLARRFKIPSEVAEGMLAHHGTGLMRFFYHKAQERYGENVDPDRYRHRGHKPTSKEMTILMLADAVEGACRAMVQHEEPTAEKIRKTIERVVAEKLTDAQLDESALTLGQLRTVKEAFAGSLIGHYHQRIPYPDFPEAAEEQQPDDEQDREVERRPRPTEQPQRRPRRTGAPRSQ